ncbi:MAG: phosphate signaling complex protein PhoU [Rhodobacteraceae bacterium]|nr:phosphate signaling complex protein PhoU [Paracoccaceae bacterium]
MNERPHTSKAFDEDLREIEAMVMTMGGLVEAAIADAAKALDMRDEEEAEKVIASDKRVDALEEEINTAVVRMIALRQPMADDLRLAVTVMKIAGNLERMGDYAKNIAKRTPVLVQGPPIMGASNSLRRMAKSVRLMLKDALDAYARRDVALAMDVRVRDREVDQMNSALFREFLTHMMEDPRNITACMHLLFIAKNLERVGDHVTSIAEQVVFMTTGSTPDDDRPKQDDTSTVAAIGSHGAGG